jgi:hypothetical protein
VTRTNGTGPPPREPTDAGRRSAAFGCALVLILLASVAMFGMAAGVLTAYLIWGN